MSTSNRPTHNIVTTTGEYQDSQTGQTKRRYHNVGVAFTSDEGHISLKFDSFPCGPNFNGFMSLYPIQEREDTQQSRRRDDNPY